MKRCPECRRDYYDDTLLYCLDDGNALLDGPVGFEPPTLIKARNKDSQTANNAQSDADTHSLSPADAVPSEAPTETLNPPDSTWNMPIRHLWTGVAVLIALSFIVVAWKLGRSTAPKESSINLGNVTLTPLTNDPGYEGEPTFSPDGETIAYVSDRSGNFEIYIQQVSGGAYRNISENPADDVQPAFSPDGRQIAFVSSRSSSTALRYEGYDLPLMGGDIWVMPALGGNARRAAQDGNFPSWSREDRKSVV